MPAGAMATGIATGSPSSEVFSETDETSISTRCRSAIASRSARLARSVSSSYDPQST